MVSVPTAKVLADLILGHLLMAQLFELRALLVTGVVEALGALPAHVDQLTVEHFVERSAVTFDEVVDLDMMGASGRPPPRSI